MFYRIVNRSKGGIRKGEIEINKIKRLLFPFSFLSFILPSSFHPGWSLANDEVGSLVLLAY